MLQQRHKLSVFFISILFGLIVLGANMPSLTSFYFLRQDIWLLVAMLVVWLLPVRMTAIRFTVQPKAGTPWALALILLLVCLVGHWLVLSAYNASRDEQMAVFDAMIFASGHFVAPIGEVWRDHADALNTTFLYPAEHRAAWVSSYLPLNAAIRAGVGLLTGLPSLTGPLWTALGALSLWGCIRHLWPRSHEAVWLGMLLYALSGQILLAGMTAYAMPAHLALNLLWLLFFLKRRFSYDLLALGVGFVAVGLHQPLMHPLFAAPILLLPVLGRDWTRSGLYFLGYLMIGLFWFSWPDAMWQAVQAAPDANPPASVGYLSRLVDTVAGNGWTALFFMPLNMARFIAWNHPLLLPLALFGLFRQKGDAQRRYTLPIALAVGVALTFLVMTVILPYQGHGFGYRYLHGLIGNFILLAVFGWEQLKDKRPDWKALMTRMSLATLVLLIPAQIWFASSFYAAYARPDRQIDALDADYAVINTAGAPFAMDLVRNTPWLDNRPVRLIADEINPELTQKICADGAGVAIVPDDYLRPINTLFGTSDADETGWQEDAAQSFSDAGCRVVPVAATGS